uniref:Uncharacterized protein n=1 Tax=Phlebotomus papatasi TaxID=29031 RepID=A0A1B0DF71_PHLPP
QFPVKNVGSWSASTSPARSPSPARNGPHGDAAHRRNRRNYLQYQYQCPLYGTTNLCQRSRSPSPARLKEMRDRYRLLDDEMGGTHHVQLSYPVLVPGRRQLPPIPSKPTTLQLKTTNINFPKLSASPTHNFHSTPHSVHSLPHPRDFPRDQREFYYAGRERERLRHGRDYDLRNRKEMVSDSDLTFHRLEYHAPLSFEQALAIGRTGRALPSPVLNGYKPKGGLHARHSDSDEEDWC